MSAPPSSPVAPVRLAVEEGSLHVAGSWGLEHGAQLPELRVAWRLAGAAGAPVVAVLGGISAGRRVFACGDGPPGWWDGVVGEDAPLDSLRLRILGMDFLGGSADTTGPATGERFPSVSTFDQARLLARLLAELGIERLHGLVGASYGGMVGLACAARFPALLERLVVISAAHRTHPLATAWRSVQRAVVRDAIARGDGPRGLALARALAMATYRSAREFDERFAGPARLTDAGFRFPVEDYLFARGASYAAQYRPESFVCLSESIDLHRVDPATIHTPTTLLAVVEDQLVPLSDMRQLRDHLGGGAQLVEIDSVFGHDAFLKEHEVLRDLFAHALH